MLHKTQSPFPAEIWKTGLLFPSFASKTLPLPQCESVTSESLGDTKSAGGEKHKVVNIVLNSGCQQGQRIVGQKFGKIPCLNEKSNMDLSENGCD